MSERLPYIRFFPRDWIGDHLLRMLTLEERGAWIDLLAIMSMATPPGHLAVDGKAMPDADAARLVGCDVPTFRRIITRLESIGVTSRTLAGIIYSRRLVRDYDRTTIYRENARQRWDHHDSKSPLHPPSEQDQNTPIPIPIPTPIGGFANCNANCNAKGQATEQRADFSTLSGMVQAIIRCRPEYACLRPASIENVLKACPPEHKAKLPSAVSAWCDEHSNALKPFDNPLASIRAMVRRVVDGQPSGQRKGFISDDERRRRRNEQWAREDADRKAKDQQP